MALAILAVSATALALAASAIAAEPLKLAHAHNDYLHTRPLVDALDHGFTSVEADIFLVDGAAAGRAREIRIDARAHSAQGCISIRCGSACGQIKAASTPAAAAFICLIDIKSAAEPTYAVLAKVLAEYADILSVVRDGKVEAKAVDVVISGSRPQATMAAESVRYAGIDGRMSDLDSELPAHLLPLVSDNWALQFKWRGKGPIGDADRAKLADAVAKAHAHGRRIRFWATPETLDAWRELRAAGVDHDQYRRSGRAGKIPARAGGQELSDKGSNHGGSTRATGRRTAVEPGSMGRRSAPPLSGPGRKAGAGLGQDQG